MRLYRKLGARTDDIFNNHVMVSSIDPRPDSVKPFVQWSHNVKYWDGYKKVLKARQSKIHRVPGKGGCKFSNQYLVPSMYCKWKFRSLRFITDLPFEMRNIEVNRWRICPYCFFGGPDKHARTPIQSTMDLTGVAGKLAAGGRIRIPHKAAHVR